MSGAGTRSLYCGTVPTLSTMTIEFWYKTSSDVDGRIMGALSGNNNGGGGNNWLLNYRGNIDFEVWPCSSCGSQDVHSNFNLRNAPYRGQWNYIAMTFDGGNTVNFYINGILDSTQHLNSTGLNTYAPPLEIGSSEGIGYINANIGGLKISNNIKTSFSYGSFANITNEPTTQVGSLIPPTVTGSVDLEVTGVNIDIDNYQDAIITAQVVNKGTQSTGNGFYTDLYIDHLPSGVGDLQNSIKFWVSDPIPAGGTANLTSEPICETYSSSPSCQIHLFSTASTLPQENDTYYVQTDSLGSLPTADKTNTVASEGHCFVQYDQFEYLSAQVGPPIDNSYGGASTITINPADASTLTSQTHNFAVPGDVDWAKFVAQAGQTYHIYTDNLGANTDTVLSLYDQNGTTLLAQNDDSGETIASSIDWTAPSSGTYYIKVSDWNPNTNGCNTNYNLVVQIESNPNPPTPESNQLYLPLAIR